MQPNEIIQGTLGNYFQFFIAMFGWVTSLLTFYLGTWYEKKKRHNKARIEMIHTLETWVESIQKLSTYFYEDSSSSLNNIKRKDNTGNYEEVSCIIYSLSIIDIKIQGIKKSGVLLTRFNKKQISDLFRNISEIEDSISSELMPLDIQLLNEKQIKGNSYETGYRMRLVLRNITKKIEDVQGFLYRLKVAFS
jgi:hypothetical protein